MVASSAMAAIAFMEVGATVHWFMLNRSASCAITRTIVMVSPGVEIVRQVAVLRSHVVQAASEIPI